MLKMSLNEIRGQIQMHPENWVNVSTTNCYAYALGLDIREKDICECAYQPGTISHTSKLYKLQPYFSYQDLLYGIEGDLRVLNLSYREINSWENVECCEWKIALYVEICKKDLEDDLCTDFHFLRTNQNGSWMHKNGWSDLPNKKDDFENIITIPEQCDFIFYKYKKCYALRLNKS